jgi:ATP-dependent DNA ligase
MKAQLAKATNNPTQYLNSDQWAMQQKIDGWRMILECGSEGIKTLNRNGDPLKCPAAITRSFKDFTTHWIFDGELLDDTYYIFDVLEIPTGNIQSWELSRRYELLYMLEDKFPDNVKLLPLIVEGKEERLEEYKEAGLEGVVFKLLSAEYLNKRTSAFLKYKFIKQVDCVILDAGFNEKDNFVLGMFNGVEYVDVGKVSSLTGDGPKAQIGNVVQVDILYVTDGNRLYQPVKPKIRTDKKPEECSVDQLLEYKTNKVVI